MNKLRKIDKYRWEIPKTGNMRVPGRIFASEAMLKSIIKEGAIKQVSNVATLPGILGPSLAMPDVHQGYGFSIGGVAAFDWDNGIISPGGVGYDINCGVRLCTTHLEIKDIKSRLENLVNRLYQDIPTGLGSKGLIKLTKKEQRKVLVKGSKWAVEQGFGEASDIEFTEDGGCLSSADPDVVSERAFMRGEKQLGTLGSGNHFIEMGVVEKIYEADTARAFGLYEGQVTLMIHTGSRGLGYQICDDFLSFLAKRAKKLPFEIPDRQLSCAMIRSKEGERYLAAMACAANYAWANRQILMHLAKQAIMAAMGVSPRDLGMRLVYDICHNIAKKEVHKIDGKERVVCVHRKGATRSFPKGHKALNPCYRHVGQPVLVPGDMGTASYVLVGTQKAMKETFGSTCHGAGRVLSRKAAKKAAKGRAIHRELEDKGIFVRAKGKRTLSEEMPDAYKDISQVIDVVHNTGISIKVAKLRPLIVVKG